MANSNSFNICGRCGTANSLNAKYCYQCGSQLKAPEEPIVCQNCRAVNNGMANFCRTCGATLRIGAQTKICPRCRKEVGIEKNQCTCGYSFATIGQSTAPAAIDPRTGLPYASAQPVDPIAEKHQGSKKGKVAAFFSLIFALAFAYILFAPSTWHPAFLASLSAFVGVGAASTSPNLTFFAVIQNPLVPGSTAAIGDWVAMVLAAIVALCLAVQIIVSLVNIFAGKGHKKANIVFFVMGIVYSLVAVFMILSISVTFFAAWYDYLFGQVRDAAAGYLLPAYGWAVLAGYFLFFWLYSLITKDKRQIEQA